MSQATSPYDAPKAAVTESAGTTQPVRVFSVSGRIGRLRYIAYGFGFYVLLALIGTILATVMGSAGGVAIVAMWLAMLVIGFMLTMQRCHDFDMSGWLALLFLVPLVNLMFWFIPGTDGPNRYGPPTPPNSAGVIVVVCVVPVLVFLGGIMAAIAIPAYQDYTLRARVSEVIVSATPWRVAVSEHYMANSKWPASAADLNPAPAATSKYGRIDLGANGVLTLTMEGQPAIAEKTILLRPKAAAGAISWDCSGGTLPPKYRPASCRTQ